MIYIVRIIILAVIIKENEKYCNENIDNNWQIV